MIQCDTEGLEVAAQALQVQMGAKEPRQHPALKSWQIGGQFHALDEYLMLLPFLNTCSRHLNLFEIEGINWVHQPQIQQALAWLDVALEEMYQDYLSNGQGSTDAEITNDLALSTCWQYISLVHCWAAGPLMVVAIMNSCEWLERVILTGCSHISSAELQSILTRAKGLKNFSTQNYRS